MQSSKNQLCAHFHVDQEVAALSASGKNNQIQLLSDSSTIARCDTTEVHKLDVIQLISGLQRLTPASQ